MHVHRSCNRLEANYAMQQEIDMIPLMLTHDYKATGWLGLFLGTRFWCQCRYLLDFVCRAIVLT